MNRLFVALDVPADVRFRLDALCAGLPGARWVPPENLHLTLRFIGEVDNATLDDVAASLDRIEAFPLEIRLRGLGHWESKDKPRVVWAGVEASDALLHLQRRVETAVVAAGLEPERRKFRPHVTLARLKDASVGSVVSYLSEHPLLDIPPFTVDRFVLYRSFLRREGSVYRPEAVYPLGGWCDDGLEEEDGEDEATTAGWHAVTP